MLRFPKHFGDLRNGFQLAELAILCPITERVV